jgi:cysteine desulfurase
MARIYLDHQATTPLDPRVREAIEPYGEERFANPASRSHAAGREVADAVAAARVEVAALIGSDKREIVFTSGATEANNLAIKGSVWADARNEKHVVVSAIEHPSVLDCARYLESSGVAVSYVGVDRDGGVDLDELEAALRPETILVSVMAANNEIGTLQPLAEIGALAHRNGAFFHCDAAQAVGKIPIDVEAQQIDLLSISAHKLYGPKGVGALFVRRDPQVALEPLIHGGGHENGLRSGTLNAPGCVGLGRACELARDEMTMESERLCALRDRLEQALVRGLPDVQINGKVERRISGLSNLTIAGVDADALMARCPELAFSSGSACSSAAPTPSHVLSAIGLSAENAECSIRLGLGRFTSNEQVDHASDCLIDAARTILELSDESHPVVAA